MKPIYERLGFKKTEWDSFKKEARDILIPVGAGERFERAILLDIYRAAASGKLT